MVERGMVGEKAGRGFYQRVKGDGAEGGSTILALDPAMLEYRPLKPVSLPALETARTTADMRARIRALFLGRDRVGDALRRTLGPTLIYAARVASDIAHSPSDIDRAMRWGFGWELGPFETIEAIGVQELIKACDISDLPSLLLATAPAIAHPPAARRIVKSNAGARLVDMGDGGLCVAVQST